MIELPTYRDASDRRVDGVHDVLDLFITNWEPSDGIDVKQFREELRNAVRLVENAQSNESDRYWICVVVIEGMVLDLGGLGLLTGMLI